MLTMTWKYLKIKKEGREYNLVSSMLLKTIQPKTVTVGVIRVILTTKETSRIKKLTT